MAADRRLLAAAFAAIAFLTAGPARGAVGRPTQTAPASGALVQFLPAFAWTPVAGADKYEFQISADAGMNSPVLGAGKDDFFTRNTRATLLMTIPNGTYWWRVRATNAAGEVSAWTQPRSFRKQWNLQPALQTPASGAALSFPANPVVLKWTGVPGAAHYLVSVASDPSLSSLVLRYSNQDNPNGPPNVAATSAALTAALAPGPYYWSVQPVDAEGNHGVATPVSSFSWVWPSTTTPHLEDLNSAPEVYDPRFSWTPVPGAARYEVEINSSADFAPGSKVCCSGTTIASTLSPTVVFKDNVYYWRVRALDPDGNAGVWNYGQSFTKTFDKVAPAGPVPGTSIKNLRMRDNLADPGSDADPGSAGYQTRVPVVRWDPVPGAASYELQVAGWSGSACAWATSPYVKKTSVPEWAPLGDANANPVVWQGPLAEDAFPGVITPGTYCFRVRARSDRAPVNQEVWGDYTYLQNGTTGSTAPVGPAFTWTDYPDPSDPGASTPCAFGYPCAGDYLSPIVGSTNARTPLFTWKPLAGANSYFVVVAKDANFSNVIDEGFTRIPAYAPRNLVRPTTYSDETTSYYWAILPASSPSGLDALPLDLPNSAKGNFQKRSTPPTKLSPGPGYVFLGQPTFQWTSAVGARTYRLQVAHDPSFGQLLDDVTTDSTSYSTNTTYPADTILYWRVRANDENNLGLTWSTTGTFQKRLARPIASPTNPTSGDFLPTWSWGVVPGAVAYDVSADLPDGTHRDLNGLRSPALTPTLMYGTGIFHWRVRAEFPRANAGLTPGPYSPTYAFTRTIREPSGAGADFANDRILVRWNAKAGARGYRVQLSGTPDFSWLLENVVTDNTAYAPPLRFPARTDLDTGRLYWRVAAQDEGNNVGDFSRPQLISRIRRMEVSLKGTLRRGRRSFVTITVSNFESGARVTGARIRISGAGVLRRTNSGTFGSVRLRLRPRRGRLLVRATRLGYLPASTVYVVR